MGWGQVRRFKQGLAFLALGIAESLGAQTSGVQTPSATQLAAALVAHGNQVATADLRAIHCDAFPEEPTEFLCRWQQRKDASWRTFSTYLALDGQRWTLIDDPHPGADPTVDLPS